MIINYGFQLLHNLVINLIDFENIICVRFTVIPSRVRLILYMDYWYKAIRVISSLVFVFGDFTLLNGNISLVPSLVTFFRPANHVQTVMFLIGVLVEGHTNHKAFLSIVISVLKCNEALTAVINRNTAVTFLFFPINTEPTITSNTTHLEHFIGELQFIGLTPVVHHKFLSVLLNFLINLGGIIALHTKIESLVSKQEHVNLINKCLDIVERKHPIIEVLIMHPVIELPIQVVFSNTVKFPLVILNDILQYERAQYISSLAKRTRVHIPIFRTRITVIATNSRRVHSTNINSHSRLF